MEQAAANENRVPYKPGMPDRRKRKPDLWARVFRWVTLLVYPLLIVFFFIFFGVASADHNKELADKIGGMEGSPPRSGDDMQLYTVLPLLAIGALIGAIGLVLSRLRARRRSDYNFQTQLILVIVSVGGLVVFFLLR